MRQSFFFPEREAPEICGNTFLYSAKYLFYNRDKRQCPMCQTDLFSHFETESKHLENPIQF